MNSRQQRKIFFVNLIFATLIVSAILYVFEATGAQMTYRDAGDGITMFTRVYKHVLDQYVEDVDPGEISQDAIEGIMNNLDPYSAFLPPVSFQQLEEDAQGEFGGLGIEIGSVPGHDYPQVMSYPIPGSPAEGVGLHAGDKIIEINGESTKGVNLNDVVGKLRGKIDTEVIIKVLRANREEPLDFTIVRKRISLDNITYSGEIDKNIGYIKLVRFNRVAAMEMKAALDSLQQDENLKGIILDIRSNPGGLLAAAKEVANTYLPKGSLIVFTKGRDPQSRMDLVADEMPTLPPGMPLVVLVNRASASASEIVAGAIQDWDRGVLVGETTFGKGSVQTVFEDLPNGAGIKLTTAHYYTPSGRCIHKERRLDPATGTIDFGDEDDEVPADSLAKLDKFYTKLKERIVYGGGGVKPDVIVKEDLLGNYALQLRSKNIFFDFAVMYAENHPDLSPDFEITPDLIEGFKEYISGENVFDYSIPGKKNLDDFRTVLKEENYDGEILTRIDDLESLVRSKRDEDFEANLETIKRILKREIASAKFGIRERTIASKKWDRQLQKSIEILNDKETYDSILSRGAKTGIVAD